MKLVSWKKCTVWKLWVKFYLGADWETASQTALRECPKSKREGPVYMILAMGKHNQAHILAEVAASHKEQKSPLMISVVFYIWEDARNWAHKTFSWQYLPEVLFCQFLPGHRVPQSWSLPWTPFRMCWRSVTAVASDFILAEPDGEWQFLVGKLYYYR